MRRMLLCLLLIIGLIYVGIGRVVATNVSNVHTASQLIAAAPLRNTVSTTAKTLADHSYSPVIALTFDDGPSLAFTPQILGVLEQYGVSATFFCDGQQVQSYPGLVQQMSQAGETIGNHGWNHSDLTRLSPDMIRGQLRSTSIAIQRATGISPTLFRPPYGDTNGVVSSIASQLGMYQILWTIDSRDWQRPGAGAIVSTVLTNARSGSIVLMHDGGGDRSQTVQALPQIIVGLRQRGFTFVVA